MLTIRPTLLPLLWLLFATQVSGAEGPNLQSCEAQFSADPQAIDSVKCFYELARPPSSSVAASLRLKELHEQHPELPWFYLYLGRLAGDSPAVDGLYRVAAGRFVETGGVRGEFSARLNLSTQLANENCFDEAEFEVQRAIRVAEASKDPYLMANAKILQATASVKSGRDFSSASRLLADAKTTVFPLASNVLKSSWLSTSGEVNLQIGRLDNAANNFQLLMVLAKNTNDSTNMDVAEYGLLRGLMERAAERPSDFGKEILPRAQEMLATAQADENVYWAEFILGALTVGDEARNHFTKCVETAKAPEMVSLCRGSWARKLANDDPKQAQEVLRQAEAAMEESENAWFPLFFWSDQMRVSWRLLPAQRAIADSWKALEAVEALRRAQGPTSRAGLFSTFSDDYYWFSGSLLKQADSNPAAVAEAFAVNEHLRGRTLFEKLAGVRPEPPSGAVLSKRLIGIDKAIQNVRGRIDDPKWPKSERENARQDLMALQQQKSAISLQLQNPAPSPPEPKLVSLDQVRQHLSPDEALLSFQVAPKKDWTGAFGGGSWLTVVTGDARRPPRVYPLLGREELRGLVTRLTAPLEGNQPDPGESQNLHELYRELLEPALADLPAGIRRLIVLPDDDLHKVPFAALGPTLQSPLVDRYQVTMAPSATLWLRERQAPPSQAAVPALVLAAPIQPDDLQPLPLAASEGQDVVDALGGGSVLRIHEKASEAFVKTADLDPFGIVHFSAHSVNDDEDPDRSSIRLTRSGRENGHLEVGEILHLHLDGKVIVLSTCESAGGKILRGEGVMSLARAFFEAKAYTVVASLWQVDDSDAKKLFEPFYRHVSEGATVAAALRAAQRERIAAGAPLKAWAAFVVLGDGDLAPLPHGRPPSPLRAWGPRGIAALLAILLVVGAALAVRARRRLGGTPVA